jgi:glycosyltransferase involved in cell wall biosynthesis
MHIAVPFYMDTIKTSYGKPAFTWGRVVASHSFLRALAESDSCQRLTIFVPTKQDIEILQKTLLTEFSNSISVIAFSQISAYLKSNPIDVLHTLETNMYVSAHIRNFMSDNAFVLTGVTLSLGNAHFLDWALQNNANGITAADCLICVTPAAKSVIESCHSRLTESQPGFSVPQTHVIPLGVSVDSFRQQTGVTRSHFGLNDDDFVILSLARFNPMFKMDFLPLLNLVALLQEKSTRAIKLVLSGASDDGSYTQYLQDAVKKNGLETSTRFVLDPTDARKIDLYRTADVFLSLIDNVQESFGLTVVEALAAGLPVVASDWNGYKALIEHEVNGYLIPTKTLAADEVWEPVLTIQLDSLAHLFGAQTTAVDLVAARDRLLEIAENKDLALSMSRAAAESAERYDWSKVIAQYFELWTRLRKQQLNEKMVTKDRIKRSSALRYIGDFSSYPSSHLSPGDKFLTSNLGNLVLEHRKSIELYGQLEEFLDLKIMTCLLRMFLEKSTLADVIGKLPSEFHDDVVKVSQNTMWLYKYGYLEHL